MNELAATGASGGMFSLLGVGLALLLGGAGLAMPAWRLSRVSAMT
jgi:hypothetical protein